MTNHADHLQVTSIMFQTSYVECCKGFIVHSSQFTVVVQIKQHNCNFHQLFLLAAPMHLVVESLRQIQFSSSHRQPGSQSFLQPRLMSSRHARDMLQGAFTSLCTTYSLCSFSPIVSIFQIVLTTVSSSIPLEYSACRSVLSSSNGFLISPSDVTRALTCSMS